MEFKEFMRWQQKTVEVLMVFIKGFNSLVTF